MLPLFLLNVGSPIPESMRIYGVSLTAESHPDLCRGKFEDWRMIRRMAVN